MYVVLNAKQYRISIKQKKIKEYRLHKWAQNVPVWQLVYYSLFRFVDTNFFVYIYKS
jgi:hypothetical protein